MPSQLDYSQPIAVPTQTQEANEDEDVVAEAAESVIGADPQVAFPVFEEGADLIAVAAGMLYNKQQSQIADKVALCVSCHGQDGIPVVEKVPIIFGQHMFYLLTELRDFRTGRRANETMSPLPLPDETLRTAWTRSAPAARNGLCETWVVKVIMGILPAQTHVHGRTALARSIRATCLSRSGSIPLLRQATQNGAELALRKFALRHDRGRCP